MESARKFDLAIGTSYDPAGIKRATGDIDKLEQRFKGVAHGGGKEGGLSAGLEGLKSNLGRGSLAFEIGHLLEGRGPLIGATLITNQFAEWGNKLVEARRELALGKIDASDFVDSMARGVPIFGKIYEFGRSIHELFTGDQLHDDIQKEETEAAEKRVEAGRKFIEFRRGVDNKLFSLRNELDPANKFALDKTVPGAVSHLKEQISRSFDIAAHESGDLAEAKTPERQKFEELTKQREELMKNFEKYRDAAQPKTKTYSNMAAGGTYVEPADPDAISRFEHLQADLRTVDKQRAEIEEKSKQLEEGLRSRIGSKFLSESLGLVGEQLRRVGEAGSEAVQRWMEHFPEVAKRTVYASEKIQALRVELENFHHDSTHELVSDLKNRLVPKYLIDEANALSVELKGRIQDDLDVKHRDATIKAEGDITSRRLRIAGKTSDADQFDLLREYFGKKADLERKMGEELRNDESHGPQIRKRYDDDLKLARDSYGVGVAELAERKLKEFMPERPAGISGETGILTGTTGYATSAIVASLRERDDRAERNAQDLLKAINDMATNMADMATAIAQNAFVIVRDKL